MGLFCSFEASAASSTTPANDDYGAAAADKTFKQVKVAMAAGTIQGQEKNITKLLVFSWLLSAGDRITLEGWRATCQTNGKRMAAAGGGSSAKGAKKASAEDAAAAKLALLMSN
jgi:hypothetical protein